MRETVDEWTTWEKPIQACIRSGMASPVSAEDTLRLIAALRAAEAREEKLTEALALLDDNPRDLYWAKEAAGLLADNGSEHAAARMYDFREAVLRILTPAPASTPVKEEP